MMKHIRRRMLLLLMGLTGSFLYSGSALAAQIRPLTLSVTTVIDNASEYPNQVGNFQSRYDAKRIYQMSKSSTYPAYYPSGYETKVFQVKNGYTETLTFGSKTGNSTCNTVWFGSNGYTDSHLSLVSVEYGENAGAYTYNGSGSGSDKYAVQPFNWIAVKENKTSVKVTLHFRYNPDIEESPPANPPSPEYKKVIDYLGDGAGNPDTKSHGNNDYRLYLDVTTQKEEEEKKSDIFFVLDVSNSMEQPLGAKSRFEVMKKTVYDAISLLSENPNNRFSILLFGTNSRIVVSASTDKDSLLQKVSSLSLPGGAEGGTNYYQSMTQVSGQIAGLSSPGSEQVVFFLTDGEPTAATPVVQALGYSVYTEVGTVYAVEAARKLQGVDRFYSIFMGSDTGAASTLQTITQMVGARMEKYMVQAASADQIGNAFNRFISQISNSLYHVTIEDPLSEYVDYGGDLKVMRQIKDTSPIQLKAGSDYTVSLGASGVKVALLSSTVPDSRYTVSFNVRASEKALDYYDQHFSYPQTGDPDTDYNGNSTSSGKPGFYSNGNAKLTYSYGRSGTAEALYGKPVVQVVAPEEIKTEFHLKKSLTGKTLLAGDFGFSLSHVSEGIEYPVAIAENDANGDIRFSDISFGRPGDYLFHVKEIIPEPKVPGMVYDTKVIPVEVIVTRSGDELVAEVRYPEGASFENHYEPQPISLSLEAKKELSGARLTKGMFQFRLLSNDNESLQTVSNQASGKISFSPLTFTREGTYYYMIREVVPVPADPNITYDLRTLTAQVKVTDAQGKLEASVSYSPEAVFKNTFSYPPKSADIQLKKVLTGMQLTAGMFDFELKDMESGEVYKAKNQSDGTISFLMTYDTPGEYTYQVREIQPSTPIQHMTYDTSVLTVTVLVEDDGTGNLVTTVNYPSSVNFYNSYKVRGGIW